MSVRELSGSRDGSRSRRMWIAAVRSSSTTVRSVFAPTGTQGRRGRCFAEIALMFRFPGAAGSMGALARFKAIVINA
jgi:hypothetical protein